MSSLINLRQNIADDVNRSNMSTVIDRAINRAITHYNSERFWFNQTTGTLTTEADKKKYTTDDGLPSDILEIDYAEITISGGDIELKQRTYQYLERIDYSGFSSWPGIYAWYGEALYLYPIPNDEYTVTLSYKKSYSELSEDTDSNDFTTNAQELIESRARWWIYAHYIKDAEMRDIEKAAELEELEQLRKRTGDYQPTLVYPDNDC